MRRLLLGSTALVGFLACAGAQAQTAANINSANLLNGFSLLGNSAAGQTVLTQNLNTSIGINNNASAALRALSIVDNTTGSLIGSLQNGVSVADGLGSKLFATFSTKDTVAANFSATALSSNYQNLFNQVNTLITGGDSAFTKNYFANGSRNGNPANPAVGVSLPAGGAFNVYDTAYKPLPANANTVGDSRPAQVAPDRIQTFTYNDFFGVSTNSATAILPTLKSNASFPSGHSTFSFASSQLLAMMVPERYQQELTRGAEFANSRIVLGAHYALDVIGARIQSTYALVQILNNNPLYTNQTVPGLLGGTVTTTSDFNALYNAATSDLRGLLSTCSGGISTCASTAATDRFSNAATNKANYNTWLTYGLSPVGPTNLGPVVPTGAEVLIASRFPYLSNSQLRDVLASTEIASGQPLDDGTGYARLNLYNAADGYGAFTSTVTVTMDASKGGFNAADSWNNNISGSGGLIKAGTGALTLTGADTYTGATTVNGGTLEIAGSIVSATTINSGGTLAGAGSTGAVTVNSGGILAPGSVAATGTLTVNGSLTFNSGSIYNVRVTPSSNDRTNATGSISIAGGTVNVLAGSGAYSPSQRYTILNSATGLSGAFSGAVVNFAFLNPVLSYDAANAYLTLNRNDISYAAIAGTANQTSVGNGLTNASRINSSAAGGAILNNINLLTVAQAQSAYDSLSGDGLAAAQTAAFGASRLATSTLADQGLASRSGAAGGLSVFSGEALPVGASGYAATEKRKSPIVLKGEGKVAPPARLWRVWGAFFGGGGTISGNAGRGSPSSTNSFYGGLIGVDYLVTPNWLVGLAAGGSDSSFSVNARSTSGSLTGYHFGAYTDFALAGSYAHASVVYSGFSNTTTRTAGFGNLGLERERGSFDSNEIRGRLEIGHEFAFQSLKATPFAAVELARLHTNGFTEASTLLGAGAGGLGLRVAARDTNSIPTFLGVKLSSSFLLDNGWKATPFASLAWVHEFSPNRQISAQLVSLQGSNFTVSGARPAANAAQVKAGFEVSPSANLTLFADFQGEFSNAARSYAGQGRAEI